ncbi:hypothetical protein Tco_0759146 [Tanacetum coccineum]
MSTSKTYQQSLADAGSENRPPMLEGGVTYFGRVIQTISYASGKPEGAYQSTRRWLMCFRDLLTYSSHNTKIMSRMMFTTFLKIPSIAWLLLAKAITQNLSNPTNNRLRASSNTRNQVVIQGDRVNIQSRNSGNVGRNNRRAYVQGEVVEGMNATKETAIIQPTDQNSDDEPSYESAFVSEVQSSSINENGEQMYPSHTKIINSTIDDDQINSNIQFDSVKGNVNSGSVEKDTHVYDQCALETLARNAYDEAAKQQRFAQKVQQQNMTLTSQIKMYKERNRVLENITKDNNYLKEFLKADEKGQKVR